MTKVWATDRAAEHTAEHAADHAGLDVLTRDECTARLRAGAVGRVAFQASGETEVFPVNYTMDASTVAFRTAVGSKLTAALEHAPVTFEVDGVDVPGRTGWSVVVKGMAEDVADPASIERLDASGLETWRGSADTLRWVRIRPDSVTGRQIPAHRPGRDAAAPAGDRSDPPAST